MKKIVSQTIRPLFFNGILPTLEKLRDFALQYKEHPSTPKPAFLADQSSRFSVFTFVGKAAPVFESLITLATDPVESVQAYTFISELSGFCKSPKELSQFLTTALLDKGPDFVLNSILLGYLDGKINDLGHAYTLVYFIISPEMATDFHQKAAENSPQKKFWADFLDSFVETPLIDPHRLIAYTKKHIQQGLEAYCIVMESNAITINGLKAAFSSLGFRNIERIETINIDYAQQLAISFSPVKFFNGVFPERYLEGQLKPYGLKTFTCFGAASNRTLASMQLMENTRIMGVVHPAFVSTSLTEPHAGRKPFHPVLLRMHDFGHLAAMLYSLNYGDRFPEKDKHSDMIQHILDCLSRLEKMDFKSLQDRFILPITVDATEVLRFKKAVCSSVLQAFGESPYMAHLSERKMISLKISQALNLVNQWTLTFPMECRASQKSMRIFLTDLFLPQDESIHRSDSENSFDSLDSSDNSPGKIVIKLPTDSRLSNWSDDEEEEDRIMDTHSFSQRFTK